MVPTKAEDLDGGFDPSLAADLKEQRKMDRFILFALLAAAEAIAQAGWSPSDGAPYTFTILGMNNKGEFVGQLAGDGHGYVYRDGVTTDLNSLIDASGGWVIKYASSINDLGQILATTDRGYVLLTPDGLPTPPDMALPDLPPVPEPSTYIVFGTLAVGFLWRRSRA